MKQSKVIKTKSVKYMPFPLSLGNFLNGVIWVIYALIKFDIFILVRSFNHIISIIFDYFSLHFSFLNYRLEMD